MQKDAADPSHYDCKNGLECKISEFTYKLFFVEDTEDVFRRRTRAPSLPSCIPLNRARHSKFTAFLKKTSRDPNEKAPEWMMRPDGVETESQVSEEERHGLTCRLYHSS